jgi:hypothetical protein
MGNIANDIIDEINIKPNKTKLILKWVIGISSTLIVMAFTLGQFKASFFTRMDTFETTLNKNTIAVEELKTEMKKEFADVDLKINKIYDDVVIISDDYREYNNKQLELIIDYGQENKDMLKRMLEINAIENKQSIANQVSEAKIEKSKYNIGVHRVVNHLPVKKNDYHNMTYLIDVTTNDTIFEVKGATQNYINNVDEEKYQIGAITKSQDHSNRYDFSYYNK